MISSSVIGGGSLNGSSLNFLGKILVGRETFLPTFQRDWDIPGPPTYHPTFLIEGLCKGMLNLLLQRSLLSGF